MSSLKSNIEYIGEWEALYNPKFNYTVFGTIRRTQKIEKRLKNLSQQIVAGEPFLFITR